MATLRTNSEIPLVDDGLVGPSIDSNDVLQPANKSSASRNTDNTDNYCDDVLPESLDNSKGIPKPADQSPTVSSSISIDSRTSTLKYSQQSFDEYRVRVKELCCVLWPVESRIANRERHTSSIAKSRILDAVRIKKLRRVIFPSPQKDFIIERLAGGTYNRIIGITIEDAGDHELNRFILRVPRPQMAGFGYIEREVAVLRYVRQNTTLPVADVITFDVTTNNPLESGYVVQSRLPGVSLHTIWDELTHEQRCTVAQEIGRILVALQAVTRSTPGIVETSSADTGSQKFVVQPFDIRSPYDDEWKAKLPRHTLDKGNDASNQTPEEWFGTQFGRWLAHELHENPTQILYWDYQYQFVEVTKQMNSLGILGDGQNCLCHFDLAARNVMVQVLPNGSLIISGIVDWDSAAFAPKFVSCAPPSWLWTNQKHYDVDENESSSEPSTPEQEEIKEVFDDVVGFDWTWLAYKPEYRLARELFYFAQHGLQDGEAQKKAVRFLKEWATLYESMMNPIQDGESSEEAPDRDAVEEDETMDGVWQDKTAEGLNK